MPGENKDNFPHADLWLCRDCFLHFSYTDICKSLHKYINSDIPLILISSYSNNNNFQNHDIKTGDARLVDLFSYPFEFKNDYLEKINDDTSATYQKYLFLFNKKQIKENFKNFSKNISKFM